MAGTIKTTTPNYALGIPYFDVPGWGAAMERNLNIVDAILGLVSAVPGVVGSWQNNTDYVVNDRVVDTDDDTVWSCNVTHTSAATGTFSDDRDSHPTYWTVVTREIVVRGEVQEGTEYYVGDFVYSTAARLGGVVTAIFTATDDLRDNIDDLSIIYDLLAFALPVTTTALSYLRRNSANTEYEERTATQVGVDVADSVADEIGIPAGVALTYLRRNSANDAYEALTQQEAADDLAAKTPSVRYDQDDGMTAAQQGQARANIDAGVLAGFRIKTINGDFGIWQRAPDKSVVISGGSGYYGPDRWRFRSSSIVGGTQSISWGAPDADFPCGKLIFTRSGVSDYQFIQQNIEDLRQFSGKKITVSFRIKGSVAQPCTVYSSGQYGTGGSPSSTELLDNTTVTVSTSAQQLSVVLDIPDLSGKTFGTDNNSSMIVELRFTETANATIQLGSVAVIEGDATAEDDPFEPRHRAQEELLCRRYYERFNSNETDGAAFGIGIVYDATRIFGVINHQPKRIKPTFSYSGASDFYVLKPGGNASINALQGITLQTGPFAFTATITSGDVTVGDPVLLRGEGTEDAWIAFDAEL